MDEADSSSVQMVPQRHSIHNNFIIRTSFLGPSNNLYCIEYVLSLFSFRTRAPAAQGWLCLNAHVRTAPHTPNSHDDGSSMYVFFDEKYSLASWHLQFRCCSLRLCPRYKDFDNFLVYGGIKFREGLSKQATNNYLAFGSLSAAMLLMEDRRMTQQGVFPVL